jgi:GNAT superfamily N-acetyltransferase
MRLRPMTPDEFVRFRHQLVAHFAAEQVAAGTWSAPEAESESAADFEKSLPAGTGTPDQLLFTAEDDEGEVGRLWLALKHPRGIPDTAWINDIEVLAERRGQGLGRRLLAAGEQVIVERGVGGIALNAFGGNAAARRLYESAGYEITTLQMRKRLPRATRAGSTAPAEAAEPGWEDRVAALWAALDEHDPDEFLRLGSDLAAEQPAGDAAATFELACANDSTGHPEEAVRLYRAALAAGLVGIRRRRAVIQLASSLRATGHAQEAVDLLTAERNVTADELDDAVTAFLALALADAGREREAAGLALGALARHLPRYGRSLAAYAAELAGEDDGSG